MVGRVSGGFEDGCGGKQTGGSLRRHRQWNLIASCTARNRDNALIAKSLLSRIQFCNSLDRKK